MADLDELFWERVDTQSGPQKSGLSRCWVWQGARYPDGYGKLGRRFGGRSQTFRAHRYAYEQFVGSPAGHVLHHCDTPLCVRPTHLFDGTQLDNIRDMDAKGRRRIGVRAKLTPAQVEEIRRRYIPGTRTNRERGNAALLAYEYGVSKMTIYNVATGRTWKDGNR